MIVHEHVDVKYQQIYYIRRIYIINITEVVLLHISQMHTKIIKY